MRLLSFLVLCLVIRQSTEAAVVTYVEATDGALSTAAFGPTDLGPFDIGFNTVDAGLRDGTGASDVFTFQIEQGQELTEIILTDFDTGATVDRMFFGIHDDSTFPVSTADMLAGNAAGNEFLGGILMGNSLNTNLMPAIGAGQTPPLFIGTGFNGFLGEGDYTVYIQQTSTANTQYTVGFTVAAAVPEPSTYAILMVVFAALGIQVWRRRRQTAVQVAS